MNRVSREPRKDHNCDTGQELWQTQKARIAARKAWEAAHPGQLEADIERFVREIQPFVRDFSVRKLAGICGCSFSFAARIMKGEQVSHPVFYGAMEKAIRQKSRYRIQELGPNYIIPSVEYQRNNKDR